MKKNNSIFYIIVILIFLIVAGGSYLVFVKTNPAKNIIVTQPSVKKLSNGSAAFDQTLPKTEPCPLNGVKYSTQQRDWWQKHRPLGIMIENSTDARPQSGLSYADVVYEALAEGGITRFMGVFYCQDAPVAGPVRSVRTYYLDFISEYADYPLIAHVGGANAAGPANALGQIDDYGWTGYNDLNQFSIGFPVFIRDYNRMGHPVATEHTMYSSTSKLWDFAATNRGLTNLDKKGNAWDAHFVKYTFKEDAPASQRPSSQTVHVGFYASGGDDYAVDWFYDPQNNNYKRDNAGVPHIDKDTGKQLTAKNIVILHMAASNANDGYMDNEHLLFNDIGTGKATIFIDGKEIQGSWKKASRTARTLLYDANGDSISFDAGNIWFTVLPLDGVLTVK